MHPAVGLLLERLVPHGGVNLGDIWLPEGTIVGMNPWVAARDTAVYGADAYEFRPERWLEADEEHLKLMERSFLAVSLFSLLMFSLPSELLELITYIGVYSSGQALGRVSARTYPCWRFRKWFRSCSANLISNCHIPKKNGSYMTIGLYGRQG